MCSSKNLLSSHSFVSILVPILASVISASKHFRFHVEQKTWDEAKEICVKEGGRLASLEDDNDKKNVETAFGHHLRFWIGASMTKSLRA